MPIDVVDEAPDDADGPDLDPGQLVYEAISEMLQEHPARVMSAISAIQRGDSWPRLSPAVRQLFVALEDRIFEDDEG